MFAYIALVCVHISFAALILGVSVTLSGELRRALSAGHLAFRQTALSAARKAMLTLISTGMTFATGLGLIFYRGGFGVVTKNYHIAMTLMLVSLVVVALIVKPATAKAVAASAGETLDENAARSSFKKVAMGVGILHTMWLGSLVLMFYRF